IADRTMPAHTQETLVIVFSGEHKSGRRLFDGLLEANSTSFWNHSFMAAIHALKYTGFVRPATLFVSAPPHHVESIRSAYAKRMLKCPSGVSIASLGEMGAIRAVQQLHFVPLSDAFCDAVAALNSCGRAATLGSVKEVIARQCSHMVPPTQEMLVQTAAGLAKEGLVHRVGQHLFVAPAPPKTTVECQTGESMMVAPEKEEKRERKKEGILARLFSKKANASPLKGGVEKKDKRSPVPPTCGLPNILPDWECDNGLVEERQQEYRPSVYSSRPRSARHQKRREERHVQRQQLQQQYRKSSSDEEGHYPPSSSSAYPTTHYGPIDPPENIERYHKAQMNRRTAAAAHHQCSVPIPSKARASTPIDSSDSAYSRSTSDHSDGEVDHTYVNIRTSSQMEETQFEESTLWNGPSTPIVTVM
ncbi:hypothetical protein PFISCL1PPCAC_16377, partial [Pristionchus fissidentatus]